LYKFDFKEYLTVPSEGSEFNNHIKEYTDLISVFKAENEELKNIIKSLNEKLVSSGSKYESEIRNLKVN
jgi:hypothetical protein